MTPTRLNQIVFPNASIGTKIKQEVKNGRVSSMLLYGPPGTGKTTLGKVIASELEITSLALFHYNGAVQNQTSDLDALSEKLKNNPVNLLTGPGFNLVIYDEIDSLSVGPTGALTRLKAYIDRHMDNTRWVFTTNKHDLSKFDQAFLDRLEVINWDYTNCYERFERAVQKIIPNTKRAEQLAEKAQGSFRKLLRSI